MAGAILAEQASAAAAELEVLRDLACAVAKFERTLDGRTWARVPKEWSLVSALLDQTRTPRR